MEIIWICKIPKRIKHSLLQEALLFVKYYVNPLTLDFPALKSIFEIFYLA